MSIQQTQTNGVHRLIVSGRLDQTQTPQLEETLNSLLAASSHVLLVDLTEVAYINSGGLRCLVSAWRKAKQQDSDLALCGLNDRLQEVFSMVGFDKVFAIHPDCQTAVNQLGK